MLRSKATERFVFRIRTEIRIENVMENLIRADLAVFCVNEES